MVIQTSERKYSDIHNSYRIMANELHEAWRIKYSLLEKENERLLNCLSFMIQKNKSSQSLTDTHSPSLSLNISNKSDFGDFLHEQETFNNIMFGSGSRKSVSDDNHGGYVD